MQHVLYYYPITCATSAHIILLESGLNFEREFVDLRDSQHLENGFLITNPRGAVPALKTPQGLLTENQAILTYVADLVPDKHLIPKANTFARAKAHEWMNYCATSVHPAVRSVFRPAAYAGASEAAQREVRRQGLASMAKCGELVEQRLKPDEWSVGDDFSASDAYLYLMYIWSRDKRMQGLKDYSKWRELALKVHQRTSTKTALAIELAIRSDYQLPEGFAKEP